LVEQIDQPDMLIKEAIEEQDLHQECSVESLASENINLENQAPSQSSIGKLGSD